MVVLFAAGLAGCPGSAKVSGCEEVTCPAGEICVDGQCKSGSCVVRPCPEGYKCVTGNCVPACAGSDACKGALTCCSGGCVNLQADRNHCGACGNGCGIFGDNCKGGTCRCGAFPSCVLGKICCSNRCADRTDAGTCPGASSLPDIGTPPPGDGPKLDGPVKPKFDGPVGPKKDGPVGPKKDGPVSPKKDGPVGPKKDGPVSPKKDQYVPPDKGPLCGDGKCNGTESCLSCPNDCGKCPCTPGQVEKNKQGCGPCMERKRSCKSTGQWGPWGACNYYCVGKYYCVNNKCAPCWPGTTEKKSCSCGTQTRTCGSTGNWGGWSGCATTCNGGYTCISNRCAKYYTAYASGGGGYCGYTYSGYKQYVYCQPGDYCTSTSQRKCRNYQAA